MEGPSDSDYWSIEASGNGLIYSVYPGWAFCMECWHEWLSEIENHNGVLCKGCAGNQQQIDEHHRKYMEKRI